MPQILQDYWWAFLIGLAALLGIAVVIIFVMRGKLKAAKQGDPKNQVGKVIIENGVRYTATKDVITDKGDVNVSHNKGDIILDRGKVYTVSKGGRILPGKYSVLSADENTDTFALRVGGLVREYKHFSDIVLNDGSTIEATSHKVILR